MNVLVGPNNAGKSTVLDAFRVLVTAHRFASRRNPSPLQVNDQAIVGYDIPAAQIPISLANIHFDYQADQETFATFSLDNGNKLKLSFYDNSRCILLMLAGELPIHSNSSDTFRYRFTRYRRLVLSKKRKNFFPTSMSVNQSARDARIACSEIFGIGGQKSSPFFSTAR